jgi:hypothetical protein
VRIGFLSNSFNETGRSIYEKLWKETDANWRNDFPKVAMPGQIIIALDMLFEDYIKEVVLGDEKSKSIAAVKISRHQKIIYDLWPIKPVEKKEKKVKEQAAEEIEKEIERRYEYQGKEMSEQEYVEWYNGLTPEVRADILPKVKITEREK